MKREKKKTENDAASPMTESGLGLLRELVAHLMFENEILHQEGTHSEGFLHRVAHVVRPERFDEVIAGALFHGLDSHRDITVA